MVVKKRIDDLYIKSQVKIHENSFNKNCTFQVIFHEKRWMILGRGAKGSPTRGGIGNDRRELNEEWEKENPTPKGRKKMMAA